MANSKYVRTYTLMSLFTGVLNFKWPLGKGWVISVFMYGCKHLTYKPTFDYVKLVYAFVGCSVCKFVCANVHGK